MFDKYNERLIFGTNNKNNKVVCKFVTCFPCIGQFYAYYNPEVG